MDKGVLSIKGERKSERGRGRALVAPRARARRVLPPLRAARQRQPGRHRATGKHGVLEISIPKRPEARRARINVQ
jgi:HSP20 family protein